MANDKANSRQFSPKIRVDITDNRIAESVRRSSSHCMIAEAIKEMLPDAKRVLVDLYFASFTDEKRNLRFIYHLPRQAQLSLIDFDAGRVPEPFSFTLQKAAHIRRTDRRGVNSGDPDGAKTNEERERRAEAKSKYNKERVDRLKELRVAENGGSVREIVKALNDPDAFLPGPIAVSEHSSQQRGYPTKIGGKEAPTAKNNFARRRRFGLKMLAE